MSSILVGRRADRTAVVVSLAVITALAWVLMVRLAGGMTMPAAPMAGGSMDMAATMPVADGRLLLVSAMWGAMMVGMMVPSAAPMVVVYTYWTRRGPASGSRVRSVAAFLSGYLVVWLAFSMLAAVLQVTLQRGGLLTAMGATSSPALGGGLLVLAGGFQVTSWKQACLRRCRTPVGFLIAEWREGPTGAVIMGLRHAAYCLGCCWLVMAVMFVVGTMNLVWMAVVAVFVLAEKVTPRSLHISYAAAIVLVGWGAWMIRSVW